jgi:hypothetical protein
MPRISLREAYDNKDVIAQIFRLRDEVNAIIAILDDIAPDGDVTNIVTKTDEQTITGKKIFTADPTIESDNYPNLNMVDNDSHAVDGQAAEYGAVVGRNADDDKMCELRMGKAVVGGVDENFSLIRAYKPSNTSVDSAIIVRQSDSGDGWATAPSRAYNSANTLDIVTIGSLASNPNVVHTTGNEDVNGIKTFKTTLWMEGAVNTKKDISVTTPGSDQIRPVYTFYNFDNPAKRVGNLYLLKSSVDGKLSLNLELLNSDGVTYSYIVLGTST